MQRLKGNPKTGSKRESMIDPALEKPLLRLHRAMNVRSFWKAVQQLLSAAMPNRVIGLTLQTQSDFAADREMDTPDAPGLFRRGPSQELRCSAAA